MAGTENQELSEEEKAKLCPEGCKPMMISMKNMKERYGLSTGDDIKDVVPYKLFPIAEVQEEYRKIGFYSDFFNFKAELEKYPDEQDVLVIADPEEKYGQNFFVCLTVKARDRELEAIKAVVEAKEREEAARLKAIADAKAAEEAAAEAIRSAVYVEKPIVVRPWASGTESETASEIAEGNVFHSRKLVKFAISRRRRDFAGPYKFNDRDADMIAGSFPMEVRQSKDPNFELKRRTRDVGLQDCASWTASYLAIQRSVREKVSTDSQQDSAEETSQDPSQAPSPSASPRSDSKSNAASPRGDAPLDHLRDPSDAVHERVPRKVAAACQTRFFSKQNNSTQFADVNAEKRLRSSGTSTMDAGTSSKSPRMNAGNDSMLMSLFLKSASRKIEESLQQNEVVDIFRGDFSSLVDEETVSFGNRSENSLPELRTFTDLKYSKNKILKCIDWHPRSKKIVAVSCAENVSFDERVKNSGRAVDAYVLVWNFQDLIHPQLVLQSPLEVQCFRFNPTAPHLIAGGTISGQVVLWDISESMEKLRANAKDGNRKGGRGDDYDESTDKAMPPLPPKYVSTIDESHKRPVTDLVWLPDFMKVNTRGTVKYNETSQETNQFATIAGDGQFLIWDVAFEEIARKRAAQRNEKRKDMDAGPEWKPHFKIVMNKLDGVGELGLRKLSIQGKEAESHFFVATEQGEFVDANWNGVSGGAGAAAADEEEDAGGKKGGAGRRTVLSVSQDHFRPCVSLERSPFFPDIYLTVGDWSFNLWCEGVQAPIFSSPFSEAYLMAGRWSPTRPGVIVLSRADGLVDIWDLTDQSHKPSMSAPIASTKLTSMEFAVRGPANASAMQLLAAGDGGGNLHILEMPRPMRRTSPNEKSVMRNFFDREVQRVQYMHKIQLERNADEDGQETTQEQVNREEDMDPKAKRKAKAEERKRIAAQLKKEEEEYRKLEAKFREELGVSSVDVPGSPASDKEVNAENVSIEVSKEEAEKAEF